jgi:hypothetical protein
VVVPCPERLGGLVLEDPASGLPMFDPDEIGVLVAFQPAPGRILGQWTTVFGPCSPHGVAFEVEAFQLPPPR